MGVDKVAIEYITSKNMWELLYETVRLMNKTMAHHGKRVSYIMSKMLETKGTYEKYEIADFMVLAMLHDIGAIKTDNYQNQLSYEAKNTVPHSIYTYLFLKYLSPLEEQSKMVLYHHVDYQKTKDINYKYKDEMEMLKVAEIIDIWLRAFGSKFDLGMLGKYRGTKYQPEACDLFMEADKKFNIIKNIRTREFNIHVDKSMDYLLLSDDEKDKYLKILMYGSGLKSEAMIYEIVSTMYICRELGRKIGMSELDKQEVYYAAMLHDLGMLAMPRELIDAPRTLNEAEKNHIKTHVSIMEKTLEGKLSKSIVEVAAAHHERNDGSGYPRGLRGALINDKMALLQIAESVTNMSQKKPYREAFTRDQIIEHLNDGILGSKYDGIIADTLVRNFDEIMNNASKRATNAIATYEKLQRNYEQVYKNFN